MDIDLKVVSGGKDRGKILFYQYIFVVKPSAVRQRHSSFYFISHQCDYRAAYCGSKGRIFVGKHVESVVVAIVIVKCNDLRFYARVFEFPSDIFYQSVSLRQEIGGNDLDYAVRDYIESVISGRETVGAPSAVPRA